MARYESHSCNQVKGTQCCRKPLGGLNLYFVGKHQISWHMAIWMGGKDTVYLETKKQHSWGHPSSKHVLSNHIEYTQYCCQFLICRENTLENFLGYYSNFVWIKWTSFQHKFTSYLIGSIGLPAKKTYFLLIFVMFC